MKYKQPATWCRKIYIFQENSWMRSIYPVQMRRITPKPNRAWQTRATLALSQHSSATAVCGGGEKCSANASADARRGELVFGTIDLAAGFLESL